MQCDLVDGLDTRMVIPLRRLHAFPKVKLSTRLTHVLTVTDEDLLLETPKMGSVPPRILKTPITSLSSEQAQISAAIRTKLGCS